MATQRIIVRQSDGWVEVPDTSGQFFLQNMGPEQLRVTMQDAPPSLDAPYHLLDPGQGWVRIGGGGLYIMASHRERAVAAVITT